MFRNTALAVITLSCVSGAIAQNKNQQAAYDDLLALGIVSVPEYEGSKDQQLVPLVFGQIRFAGNRFVSIEGTGARMNVLDSPEWAFGPSFNFGFGRNDEVENQVVALLEEVDTAIEVGAFLSRSWQGVGHPSASLSAGINFVHDIANAHDGWQAQAGVGYGRSFGKAWRVTSNVGVTFVDDNYAETYFTVSTNNASRSGLAEYSAEGGIKDYGVNFITNYQFNQRWSAVGFASFRRLIGDAADSPVVSIEGDSNQNILAVGIGYSF